MLAATIHLLRGTPYIYMGEELGMIDPTYTTINDYVDIEALNAYESLLAQGHSEKKLSRSSWLKHAIIPEHQCTGMMVNLLGSPTLNRG